jgi:hypothetical protein
MASLFGGRRNTFGTWDGKIAKRIGTMLSGLHSSKTGSRRIASYLTLSISNLEEVS